jgi:hypothetical protein
MLRAIIIKQDGLYARSEEFDGVDRRFDLSDANVAGCFRMPILIDAGVMLRDLLNIINALEKDTKTFVQGLLLCSVDEFMNDKTNVQLDVIVKKIVVQKTFVSFKNERNVQQMEFDFNCYGLIDGDETQFGLEFIPWSSLLDAELVLAEHGEYVVEAPPDVMTGELLQRKSVDKRTNVTTTITFYEFLIAIFDELCFFGSPERRNEEFKRVEREIKKMFVETSKSNVNIKIWN